MWGALLQAIPAAMQGMGSIMGGAEAAGGASQAAGASGGGMGNMMNPQGLMGGHPDHGMSGTVGDPSGYGPQAGDPIMPDTAPAMPTAPTGNIMESLGNVSGFANYGMTPPTLPNAQAGYGGLMNMANSNDPHKNRAQDPFAQQQSGNLMGYLQALARG